MDVATFCGNSRVLVIAGKGGVGKTTMSATLALAAAQAGLSVLLVELEGKSGIAAAFGVDEPLLYEEAEVARFGRSRPQGTSGLHGGGPRDPGPGGSHDEGQPGGRVRARRITPDDALLEYLADHGLQRISKRLLASGVIDVVATAIPGIRDVLVLGKVKQLERDRVADLVIVDAPATGHAVTFLTSASGLLDAARAGPVRSQASDVVEFLTDPARCQVLLVTLPEEMPVSETIDAAFLLEDRAGVRLGPVLVNCCDVSPLPIDVPVAQAATAAGVTVTPSQRKALEDARQFRMHRRALQAEQIQRLAQSLPLPQILLPELAAPAMGRPEIGVLSQALARGIVAMTPGMAGS